MRKIPLSSMKTSLVIPGVLALAALSGLLAPKAVGAASPPPSDRVVVVFDHPEKFIDIRIVRYPVDEEKDRNHVLAILRDYITQRSVAYLPEGYHFYIRITDVRLAGQFPYGGFWDYRVVSRHTPPVFVFSWTVTNSSGTVVKMASENLIGADFMDLGANALGIEPYHFEKAVLDAWMRENLRI